MKIELTDAIFFEWNDVRERFMPWPNFGLPMTWWCSSTKLHPTAINRGVCLR